MRPGQTAPVDQDQPPTIGLPAEDALVRRLALLAVWLLLALVVSLAATNRRSGSTASHCVAANVLFTVCMPFLVAVVAAMSRQAGGPGA